MKFLLAAVMASVVACVTPSPTPPNTPEASVGDASALLDAGPSPDACSLACADYMANHCRVLANCVDVCRKAVSDGLIRPPSRSVGVCP